MRVSVYPPVLSLLCLLACQSGTTPTTRPSSDGTASVPEPRATAQPSIPSASSANPTPRAEPPSAPAPSTSVSASAAGPCPPSAKRYDDARFCVVLPEKTLDVTYANSGDEGEVLLEDRTGGVIRFSWVPASRLGNTSIKEQLERVSKGEELVASGDMPGGAWVDVKSPKDTSEGKHVVQSVVKTKKHLVNCHYTVSEEHAEQARAVCRSVREY